MKFKNKLGPNQLDVDIMQKLLETSELDQLQSRTLKMKQDLEKIRYEREGLDVRFKNNEGPGYHHKRGDAGYDLFVKEDTWIWPFIPKKIPLDFACEIPELFFGYLTSRSGTSSDGIFVIPGIIDQTYRGQLAAITVRLGFLPKKIKKGSRISQLIFLPYAEANMTRQSQLSETERNMQGFGSSGLK